MISTQKEVVVSGIRATGRLHLGNYIGAMQKFPPLQNNYQCYFFIADYHTLTTLPDPELLRTNLVEIVIDYLAAGLDPAKSVIFAQSSVPEIAELSTLLGMVSTVGELQRCPTFKEKVRQQPNNVNLGLFSYPVLMASDILIQKANLVPVGEDQLPHIELAKAIARRFNERYGEVFPIPEALQERAIRVPGIDGSGKMGKSDNNTIDLMESPESISTKIKGAVTDTKRIRRNDPGHPFECNMYALHEFVSTSDAVGKIRCDCETAAIGCVDCKKSLALALTDYLSPFQERRIEIAKSPDFIKDILHEGGKKARESACVTIEEVRTRMGLQRF